MAKTNSDIPKPKGKSFVPEIGMVDFFSPAPRIREAKPFDDVKVNADTFEYRGLVLTPTFVNDARSVRLEMAMRAIAKRTNVVAE